MTADYNKYNPDHRQIYKFIRTLFNAAQLTAECAIITLVYLERYIFVIDGNTKLAKLIPTVSGVADPDPNCEVPDSYRTAPVNKL